MKYILSILFVSGLMTASIAQSLDKERMYRDIEVAENALSTVLSSGKKDYSWPAKRNMDIEADFVKDYGVVFMVSGNNVKYFDIHDKVKDNKGESYIPGSEVSKESEKKEFIENCKIFLADYAGIIGQLKDDYRISIRRGGGDSDVSHLYFADSDDNAKVKTIWDAKVKTSADSELIVEVKVSDINTLRKGNISRDDFFNKVEVQENTLSYEKDADLETLSAMFHRLYQKDLSKTYYSERKPKYSKLSNFGVIIKMKFYSSYVDNDIYSMPTINKKGLTLEERNDFVMELLPQFESEFKENLVNYGRTMKNLDSDEQIVFEINMTTCEDCKDFPRVMKFSINKSVLHKYNRGMISMDEAVKSVDVDHILD